MKKLYFLFCFFFLVQGSLLARQAPTASAYETLFERSGGTETPPYAEVIAYFQRLAADFEAVRMLPMGITDSGEPLHLLILDEQLDFDPATWHEKGRPIVFIQNGIHPGEPDGIDASMLFLRDILLKKIPHDPRVALAIVPVYNVGGHLNRNTRSRVNQNGPEAYGYRGNARNYDLNRDFLKADTRNARSFQQLFQFLKPHVFIDTHVSNGADYQHVMTMISTQSDRLGGRAGRYLREQMNPLLYAEMEKKGFPMIPYMSAYGNKPEDGWPQFKDLGRYSSGYAALFSTMSFMPETHMLKPYADRVASTYAFFEVVMEVLAASGTEIVGHVQADRAATKRQELFPLNFVVDRSRSTPMQFMGYRSGLKPSALSGKDRLYYDRAQPFTATIPFYEFYTPSLQKKAPKAYVIPQGWHSVIENLKRNNVRFQVLEQDSALQVTAYKIASYQTSSSPFEGHFMHRNVSLIEEKELREFRKGDYLVLLDQEANRFLIEVLEPESEDSFFVWNFFDTILQAKEGFSAYVFEDLAASYLEENPELKADLEKAKAADPELAESGPRQLRWVYERSPWKDPAHMRYPIYRIER
ncbi:MAG: M14 family zinc carboxypeptidase [Nitritalea sp.]